MKLLDAVNLVLPKVGERPITSLTAKHPTLAILLPILTQTRRTTLRRGWWFNEFDYTAYPSPEGEIDIGADTLSFIPEQADTAVVRGQRLFNPINLSYVFDGPIDGRVVHDVQFEELPEAAASYVFNSALVEMYATDLGVTDELRVWQSLAGTAWSELLSEHLRQRRHSTRKSRKWAKLRNALRG